MNRNFVFLSVSELRDSLLMWSHYTGEHKGLLIGFDATNEMFKPGKFSVGGLSRVKYSRSRYVVPPTGLVSSSKHDPDAEERVLFTKSRDWEYERELRLLAHPKQADEVVGDANTPIYLYKFAANAA